jgi:hypothetical protein
MEIANSPATAAAISDPVLSEPISPELVLVDPELRRAVLERARLQVVPAPETFPEPEPAVEPEPVARPMVLALPPPAPAVPWRVPLPPLAPRPPSRTRRYLTRAVLPLSLALNAILIAVVVSDARNSPQASPAPPVLEVAVPGKTGQKPAAPSGPTRHPRNPGLERKLLNLIVEEPRGKLPRALIDSKTGLAKNGLQAVCRESSRRSFLCVVQPAKHKPGQGLYVRYRLNRKGKGGTFTWYRYRKG